MRKKIEDLESELFDLKIATRAKDQYIQTLASDRAVFVDQISKQSRQIDQLETRLELPGGPQVGQLPEAPSDTDPSTQGPRDLERDER